jgi:hypothetical protein
MKLKEFTHILLTSALTGADMAIAAYGGLPAAICKAEAYRLYGRCDVDRWISEGLIIPTALSGSTSKKILDRTTLERIAASSNRITYQPVADRKK